MSEQEPEPLEGTISRTVTDGVYAIDLGLQDLAIVSLRFNEAGKELIPALLEMIGDRLDEDFAAIQATEKEEEVSDGGDADHE